MSLNLNISTSLTNGCKTLNVLETTGLYDAVINTGGWNTPNPAKSTVTSATLSILFPGATTSVDIDVTSSIVASNAAVSEFLLAQINYSDLLLPVNFIDGLYEFTYTVTGVNNVFTGSVTPDTGDLSFTVISQACGVGPFSGSIQLNLTVTNNSASTIDTIVFEYPEGNFQNVNVPGLLPGNSTNITVNIFSGTYTPYQEVSFNYLAIDSFLTMITSGTYHVLTIDCGFNSPTYSYTNKFTRVFICNAKCCIEKEIVKLNASFDPECGCCENREKVKDLQLADMLITSLENTDCIDSDLLNSHIEVLNKICKGKSCCN